MRTERITQMMHTLHRHASLTCGSFDMVAHHPLSQCRTVFSTDKPSKLFDSPIVSFAAGPRLYAASKDGQRFLVIKPTSAGDDPSRSTRFVVELNWFEELRRRVPTEANRSQGASSKP
jgi:hypothetical protein